MLTSLAIVFLCGLVLSGLLARAGLPGLLGMLITGMLLGPFALDMIDDAILAISADLRQLALVIILARAGLSMDLGDLRRVGRPALLMCFVPACFEIAATVLLAPLLLGVSVLEAAIMGSVLAAVSPAVVVPRMLGLMEQGYGVKKGVPQMVMAGASVDDVFVIVLFSTFVSLGGGEGFSALKLVSTPVAIVSGVAVGAAIGCGFSAFYKRVHVRDTTKVIVLLSISFLLVAAEGWLGDIPFSGLIAVMAIGVALLRVYPVLAKRLSVKFSQLWVAAEVLLFVLVGASVDMSYAFAAGPKALLLVALALASRMAGAGVCVLRSGLNGRERLFCMLAYLPKATVQAAIGGVPLAMGLPCGNLVLTVAVLSILVSAPLGAIAIDATYKKLLTYDG